jgi:toxin ParE1/3/4
MRIIILDEARDDIGAIERYIRRDSPAAARRVMRELRDRIDLLADQQHLGRNGRWPHTRELVVPPYVIPYQVRNETVEVLRVLHGTREWPDRPAA